MKHLNIASTFLLFLLFIELPFLPKNVRALLEFSWLSQMVLFYSKANLLWVLFHWSLWERLKVFKRKALKNIRNICFENMHIHKRKLIYSTWESKCYPNGLFTIHKIHILNLTVICRVGIIIILILLMRKLRLMEVKYLSQSLGAKNCAFWDVSVV